MVAKVNVKGTWDRRVGKFYGLSVVLQQPGWLGLGLSTQRPKEDAADSWKEGGDSMKLAGVDICHFAFSSISFPP